MNLHEVLIEGTLQHDGTLKLDSKPNLPPGRVTVVLRQEMPLELPQNDPFWRRMQSMWDVQKSRGNVTCNIDETEAEQRRTRDEWDEHQQAIEQVQEECRLSRLTHEVPKS